MTKKIVYSEPVIVERKVWNQTNITLAVLFTFLFIVIEIAAILIFRLDEVQATLIGFILIFIDAILLFFLIEPTLLREIHTGEIQTIEKPIIKTIEKPIIKEIEKIVHKRVPFYIEKPRRKLNIPKYSYFGSSETKTYHKRGCRLGKLIKRKYKVSNNSEAYFKKKGYKGCKVCVVGKKKKVKKK